ncbi:MAG TPA: MFS transporter, partial [Burkholderiales bacterium]|nr:MFS transporter [Burkholderiales bacterium]
TTAFLLRGPGFTATEVGAISKGFGLVATIGGALVGGALMAKLRLYRALLLFGILQAVTNLGFMVLAAAGRNYPMLYAVIGAENLCGGMGTAAYVALLMALCDRRFSATQYALLSALSAVGRVYVGPAAGYLVESLGWPSFFFCTFLIALPGVVMLYVMRRPIEALDSRPAA